MKILRATRKSIRFIFRLSDYNKSIFRPIDIVMKTQTVSYMKEHANIWNWIIPFWSRKMASQSMLFRMRMTTKNSNKL